MKLVIAEKPALGKDIALAIPGECQFRDGYTVVGDYTVTWAIGHIIELQEPDAIDSSLASPWRLETLPFNFSPWPKVPAKRTQKQFKLIQKLLQGCDSVIHAGDPDDEGQLIVDEILEYCGNTKPVYRLSTNDNNHAVIRKALNQLKPNAQFEAEGRAAYARSVSDLLFGLNLTRFYTIASGQFVSVGRVQTPTLGLVVQRDFEIESHVKRYFYQLQITVTGQGGVPVSLNYVIKDSDPTDELLPGKITDKAFFEQLMANLQQRSGQLVIEHIAEKKSAPLPFNLTKLQTAANKAFGFSTAKTKKITQTLRDKHKAITYNRTDCQYLNDEHFDDAPQLITQIQSNLNKTFNNLSTEKKPRCFNSKNVSAHHAIIPTLKDVKMSDLTPDEAKIYEMIATYYLIQFMPPADIKKSIASIVLDSHTFTATASTVINPSWQTVLGIKDSEDKPIITRIPAGSYPADLSSYDILEKETKPPTRYTEGTLTADMTSVAKYIKNDKVKAILLAKDDGKKGENGSIGTVATRDDIIEKLIQRKFLMRQKKQIISTELGREFYNFLPEAVKSLDITAYWWAVQDDIKNGTKTADDLINAVYRTCEKIIGAGTANVPKLGNGSNSEGGKDWQTDTCPDCGQAIQLVEKAERPFWGHVDYKNNQCETRFDNVEGKPVKRQAPTIDQNYKCPDCEPGYLQRRESKKKKGNFFWGCSNWKNRCKHIAWDENGKPQEMSNV